MVFKLLNRSLASSIQQTNVQKYINHSSRSDLDGLIVAALID